MVASVNTLSILLSTACRMLSMADDERSLSARAIDELVGERVRRLREGLGVTQLELAERLTGMGWSIGPTSVTKIEKGTRSLRVYEVEMVAKALGAGVTDIIWNLGDDMRKMYNELLEAALEARRQMVMAAARLQILTLNLGEPGGREQAENIGLLPDGVDLLDQVKAQIGERLRSDLLEVSSESREQVQLYLDMCGDFAQWLIQDLVVPFEDDDLAGQGVGAPFGFGGGSLQTNLVDPEA